MPSNVDSCASLNLLAYRRLGIAHGLLRELAREADRHYTVGDRLVDGKIRCVAEPDALLMRTLKTAHRTLLARVPVSNAVHSVRGRSTFSNAEQHCGQPCVIRLDIEKFFPSVRLGMVEHVWVEIGYAPRLAQLLALLTTYAGVLPVGAPTSTALGNLVLRKVDARIEAICVSKGVRYTRWVDDLIISGARARELVGPILQLVRTAGFTMNRAKIEIAGSADRQIVTGLTVNGQRPGLPREVVDRLRAMSRALRSEPSVTDRQVLRRSVEGLSAYVTGVRRRADTRA
jgi:RNA-directed DNA polymerase